MAQYHEGEGEIELEMHSMAMSLTRLPDSFLGLHTAHRETCA